MHRALVIAVWMSIAYQASGAMTVKKVKVKHNQHVDILDPKTKDPVQELDVGKRYLVVTYPNNITKKTEAEQKELVGMPVGATITFDEKDDGLHIREVLKRKGKLER